VNVSRVGELIAHADRCAGRLEWGEAFQRLGEACAIAPADPAVIVRLGRYQLQIAFPSERWLPMFERAARLSSFSPGMQTELGLAYSVAGKLREASNTLTSVLKSKECPPLAMHLLALLCARELRHDEAKKLLRSATHIFPRDVRSRFLLAQYHEFEGDYASAGALLHRILDLDPDYAPAHLGLKRIDRAEKDGRKGLREAEAAPHSAVMLVDDRRIDRRVLDEARSLGEAGWDVTVVAGEPPEENPTWDEECYPDIRIMRVSDIMLTVLCFEDTFRYGVPYRRKKVAADRMMEYFSRLLPDPAWHRFFQKRLEFYIAASDLPASVYVAHDLPQLPAAAMAALDRGAYLVYDAHELFPEQSFVQNDRPLLSAMEKHLAPLADRLIVVNESMVQEMNVRYGVTPEVILNCPSFDLEKLPLGRTDRLRESLGIPPEMKILLYQGNIVSGIRNLETAIEGMALLGRNDIALVLMGPDNGGGGDLIALARERNLLARSVFFHPSVRQSDLLTYTVSADAGLIPYAPVDWNTKYCTPNKLYEFIVAELPILANNLPELTRFVEHQGIGVNLPMARPEEIAQAIDRFFSSDREGFRKRLREISSRFVWQNREGQRIVRIYEEMLNDAPRLAELPDPAHMNAEAS